MMNNYYKPTPKKWRKFGDALLASAAVVGGGGLMAFDQLKEVFTSQELKVIIGATLFIGIAGKFLTNFFKEDEQAV
jgi:NAD(P)H-dependent FMN reductase